MSYVSSDRRGLWGLGDSTPEIEVKANAVINAVAGLRVRDVVGGTLEDPIRWFIGSIPYGPYLPPLDKSTLRFIVPNKPVNVNVAQVRNKLTEIIIGDFMTFLIAAGYNGGAANHMAWYTTLAYIVPPFGNVGIDRWGHDTGSSSLDDTFSPADKATYLALKDAVLAGIKFYGEKIGGEGGSQGVYHWQASDVSGAGTAYSQFLDFVWQKLLVMLRSTPRESVADVTIRAGIKGKFQQLLQRDPTQQEIDAWFPQIKAGTKTLDDLGVYIKGMVEYTQKHPAGTDDKKNDKKEAGTNLDFLKSPWVWVAAAAAGGFYYWTQVKNKSMGQLPYVGKYLKGR